MDWLTDNKIPVGKVAKTINDWLNDNLGGFFDLVSVVMEALINAILWCLQSPHPLVIIALFIGLAWYLQRSWKVCLGVLLGFLFILNQGYWEETTESLTLILSDMQLGDGLGHALAGAGRPPLLLMTALPPGDPLRAIAPCPVLTKPFDGATLSQAISQVLDD